MRRLAFALALLSGCTVRQHVDLAALEGESGLWVSFGGEGATLITIDPGSSVWLASEPSDQVLVALYSAPVSSLRIPGALEASYGNVAGCGQRRLPAPDRVLAVDTAHDPISFSDAGPAGQEQLQRLVIAAPAPGSCEGDDVCVSRGLCLRPCPTIAAPIEPSQPEPPEEPIGVEVAPDTRCAEDEIALVSAPSCAPITPCPPGDWPDVGSAPARYVRATAAPGGDGSPADPFATIADALVLAPRGALLVLDGTFDAPAVISALEHELRGVCPARTRVDGGLAIGVGAVLRDLTIESRAGEPALDVTGSATVSGLALVGHSTLGDNSHGVLIAGGTLTASRVRVRGFENGLLVGGGRARISEAAFEPIGSNGLSIQGGANVDLTQVHVSIDASQTSGAGVFMSQRSKLSARQLRLSGPSNGIFADASDLDLADLWIEDLGGFGGVGLQIEGGSQLRGSRLHVRVAAGHGAIFGLETMELGSRVELVDLVIEATTPPDELEVLVMRGLVTASLARVRLRGFSRQGLTIRGPGVIAQLSDLDLEGVDSAHEDNAIRARGARVTLERVRVARWHRALVVDEQAGLDLRDFSALETDNAILIVDSHPVLGASMARVTLSALTSGLTVQSGQARIRDLSITSAGRGLAIEAQFFPLDFELTRFNIDAAVGPGLHLSDDAASRVALSDGVVRSATPLYDETACGQVIERFERVTLVRAGR